MTVRTFLQRKYLIILISICVFTTTVNLLVAYLHMNRTIALLRSSIENVLALNRNEFLDELALSDIPALKQHLTLLRNRLKVDSIELNYEGQVFTSGERDTDRLSGPVRILSNFYRVPPLQLGIADNFGSFRAEIRVLYPRFILQNTVWPLLQQAMLTTLGIIFLISLIFYRSFVEIRRHLLKPLRVLSSKLRHESPPMLESRSNLIELEELYEAVRQNESLKAKAAVAEVAAQVAHDIRSPLAALSVVCADLKEIPDASRELLRSAAQRIQEIADNLMTTHRRAESAHPSDVVEPVTIGPLLATLRAELSAQYKDRPDVGFNYDLGQVNLQTVYASRGLLLRVLSNISNNAVEAMEAGGEVRIHGYRDGSDVVIAVSDNGRGIPGAILPRVTDKGFTFDKALGTGLGLSFAKQTLETWGGTLVISSQLGVGTQVEVRLREVALTSGMTRSIMAPTPDRGKVVVLDDEPTVHKLWRSVLDRAGVQAEYLSTASQMIERAQRAAPSDIFLIDYDLEPFGENGLEIAERLGIQRQSILVTGQAFREDIRLQCELLNVRLMPKEWIPYISLETV